MLKLNPFLIGLGIFFWAGVALAQDGELNQLENDSVGEVPEVEVAETSEPARLGRAIDEVVVTAQKREESQQDVPIAITAFSGEAMEAAGITHSYDLATTIPNLVYNGAGAYSYVYLRGVGTDLTSPFADSSVATYIDGVYYPFLHALAQSFGNIERIEVLKGPQGTLFGRNSTGGAFNIVTKTPGDEFDAGATVSYGNYKHLRAKGHVAVPITDWLSLGLAGFYDRRESYYEQVTPGNPTYEDNFDRGIRGKVAITPTDDLDVLLTGYWMLHSGAASQLWVAHEVKPAGAALGVTPTKGDYKSENDYPGFNKMWMWGAMADISYEMNWATIKSISSYQDVYTTGATDFDGSGADVVGFTAYQPAKTFTQEFQLISNGPDWLDWIVGAYYLWGERAFDPVEFGVAPQTVLDPLNDLLGEVGGLLGIGDTLGIPDLTTLPLTSRVETNAWAVFGQATWHINEWANLTGGLRYSYEERALKELRISLSEETPLIQGDLINNPPDSREWDDLSPKVALDVHLDDDIMIYASYSKGFKSGTWNPITVVEEPNAIEPELLTAYEIGLKSDWFSGLLRANLAAFYYDYQDIHVQTIALTSGGAIRLENAGKATIQGAEADITVTPFDGAFVSVALGYLDGQYDEFFGSGWDEETGLPFQGDFSGNRTVRTPEFTVNVQMAYAFLVFGNPLEISGNYYRNSGYYTDGQNTAWVDPYDVWGGRITYDVEEYGARLSLFGKNLTDTKYPVTFQHNDFALVKSLVAPRTYGVRLEWTL
ncbi:MAG: TonB-dependent receptor [Alphaproteobacteria bacterium]